MTADESVPNAGSQLGRYVLTREVARGALGPLYMAEREVGEGVHYGLARVVPLPAGLPAKDEQVLADAIWDSTNVTHELVLRVADVVTGKGWLALVHEHSEGSLIDYLQGIAAEMRSPFPAKVASRVALDVIEGLEQSRDHCAANHKVWRAGSVAPGSLLLGADGRVRALDGQISAAVLRVPAMREQAGAASFAAPEALEDGKDPTERSDVFSVGVLLWELLTGKKLFDGTTSLHLGRGFKIPKIAQSVPNGIKVPQGLIHAVHTAIEAEPMKRQASLRELAVAIVMGVEEVATYEQVVSFTDTLLIDPSTRDDEQPTVLATALAAAPVNENESATAAPAANDEPASTSAAAPEQPAPAVDVAPNEPQPDASRDEPATHVADEVPLLDHAPSAPAARMEVPLLDHAPAAIAASAEVPLLDHAPSAAAVVPANAEPTTHAAAAVTSEPDAESSKPREKLHTLPGNGSASADAGSRPSVPAPSKPDAAASTSQPPPEPFRLVTDEPFVPVRVQPVQTIDPATLGERDEPAPKSGPSRSNSVRPVASASPSEIPDAPAKKTLQLSLGTLVLGFSTTVLAVIVIMLVLQRSQGSASRQAPMSPVAAASESAGNAGLGAARAQSVAVIDPSPTNNVKQPDAGAVVSATPKVGNVKKGVKEPKAAKSSAPDDAPPDSKGQTPNKHYVPNEL